jgi:hypothetical protein
MALHRVRLSVAGEHHPAHNVSLGRGEAHEVNAAGDERVSPISPVPRERARRRGCVIEEGAHLAAHHIEDLETEWPRLGLSGIAYAARRT